MSIMRILFYILLMLSIPAILYFVELYQHFEYSGDTLLGINLMAGSVNGRFVKSLKKRLSVMSVLVNNLCNLKCRHCYLQAKRSDTYLTSEEWNRFFTSVFSDTRPDTLCFAGKEVFFDEESAGILFDAISTRNRIQHKEKRKTEIGVITNGTLLHNYKELILKLPPDYIDISIDGMPVQHDYIRGDGSFSKMEKNLFWLAENFSGNIWITHTVMSHNLDSLPDFIEFIHNHFGVSRFSVGLYKDTGYTDSRLKITQRELAELFQRTFEKLGDLKLNNPVQVVLEMDHTQDEFLPHLIDAGWIDPNEPFSSVTEQFDNSLMLSVYAANIPVGLWRCVRITPEGYWLASEDLMNVKDYKSVEVANLRDYRFDSEALYLAGIESERFRDLLSGFPDDVKNKLIGNHRKQLQES